MKKEIRIILIAVIIAGGSITAAMFAFCAPSDLEEYGVTTSNSNITVETKNNGEMPNYAVTPPAPSLSDAILSCEDLV
ncbi:MAG: hypothetical protein PHQ96_01300 [Candidatus Omnitrophica bacterium]|nr:hypothetical protein [Candidatus Omnitrophota bacterium]